MSDLFAIGQEIEKVLQMYCVPQDTLEKLLAKRQELLESLETVEGIDLETLREQDSRILSTCQKAKDNLAKQIQVVQSKNERTRASNGASRYIDSHC